MFTLEELLSKKNQRIAMAHLAAKKEGSGSDGVKLSELEEYWSLNKARICKELEQGVYLPGVVKCFEITNNVGKRRKVCNLTTIDRFLGRLLAQKLERYLAPEFLPGSYAYQAGKGTLDAVNQAKSYIEQGKRYVAVLDIKDYFDTIPLQALMALVKEQISDERIQKLIEGYLYCRVDYEGQISAKTVGILQGSPISPILSNWYLHGLDCFMEEKAYAWIRFADNIYIYTEEGEQATGVYNELSERLKKVYALTLNVKKSGVFEAVSRGILGYDFAEKEGAVEIQRHQYQRSHLLHYWQPTQIQRCMYVILNYDVRQKRVGKAMKICRKYLNHVQRSVFEGLLTEATLKHLKKELEAILVTTEDAVSIYQMESLKYTKKEQIGVVGEFGNII
ncbi:MAG: CRISPR-associated endonuclease Cas2 [Lachnospiraceae bacterium]|nr:CRISPR-associated endonuclease Cas2 [Lachnospiraceae bacterium]